MKSKKEKNSLNENEPVSSRTLDPALAAESRVEPVKDLVVMVSQLRNLLVNEEDVPELLPAIYRVHDFETMGVRPIGRGNCGSVKLSDAPKCLYRAVFLFRPERLSFRDLPGGPLLTLVSPDYSFVATIAFVKYELGLYFGASEQHIGKGRWRKSSVIPGMQCADNGVYFRGPAAEAWFGLLHELLEREWLVHAGNDFKV